MWTPPQRLVSDSLVVTAQTVPDKQAVADEQGSLTWSELYTDALRFARVLQDGGLQRGDRVVLYLDNSLACVRTIFGVLLAGGVISVVNTQTKVDKLAFILNNCEAAALVTDGRVADIAESAMAGSASVRKAYSTAAPSGRASIFTELDAA